jgi:hypothetical protein
VPCFVASFAFGIACQSVVVLTPVAPSETIHSAAGDFTLTPMLGGWSRKVVDPRDEPSEDNLVLHHESAGLQVIVHVHEGAAESLDAIVLGRRRLIAENWRIVRQTEERSFRPRSVYTPVSTMEYQVIGYGGAAIPINVGVVRGHAAVIEIVAFGGSAPTNAVLFKDLLGGFQFAGSEVSEP